MGSWSRGSTTRSECWGTVSAPSDDERPRLYYDASKQVFQIIQILKSKIMYTPKHKPPILGYARSNKNKNRLSNDLQTSHLDHNIAKSQSANNLIYHALMSDISEDHSNYMKRLEKECLQRKSQSHLRSKTIKTVGSSPTKEHSPQENSRVLITPNHSIKQYHTITPKAGNSVATLKHTQRFFSPNLEECESNPHPERTDQSEVKEEKFLHFLDNYVGVLSRESDKQSLCSHYQSQQDALNKLNLYEYKLREMELHHESQIKRYHKRQKLMKSKLWEMNEQIVDLTIRLRHQHQERKRFQHLFLNHQKQLRLKQGKNRNDLDLSSFSSKDLDFSINSELDQELEFQNFKRFEKSSIKERGIEKGMKRDRERERQRERESEIQMNTSQKISRFLRKPFNDVRSTKPGVSVSDQEQIY